jgi:2'-5' RNA ligase
MPAHVTLIYPFTDDSRLVSARINEAQAVVESFSAFEVLLSEVRRFDNLPNESYVWLAPKPAQPFVEMVEALASVFPDHPPFGGTFPSIVPHLTVAASTDDDLLRRVEDQLVDALPIKARATKATIMENVGGSWRLRAGAPLAHV